MSMTDSYQPGTTDHYQVVNPEGSATGDALEHLEATEAEPTATPGDQCSHTLVSLQCEIPIWMESDVREKLDHF